MFSSSCSTKRSPSCFTATRSEAGLARGGCAVPRQRRPPGRAPVPRPLPPPGRHPPPASHPGPGSGVPASPLPRSSPLEVIRILQPGGLREAVARQGRRRRRRRLPAAISHLEAEQGGSTGQPWRGPRGNRAPGGGCGCCLPCPWPGGSPDPRTTPGLCCTPRPEIPALPRSPRSPSPQCPRASSPLPGVLPRPPPCTQGLAHPQGVLQAAPAVAAAPGPKPQGEARAPWVVGQQGAQHGAGREPGPGASPAATGRPRPPPRCAAAHSPVGAGLGRDGSWSLPVQQRQAGLLQGCGTVQGFPTEFLPGSLHGRGGRAPSCSGSGGSILPRGPRTAGGARPTQSRLGLGTYSDLSLASLVWGS